MSINNTCLNIIDDAISCFGDCYIGIRGLCDTVVPTSGLYIDDLPGLNIVNASKTADSTTVKGQTLLERCIANAIRVTTQDFMSLMAKSTKGLQFNSLIADGNVVTAGSDTFTDRSALIARIKIEKSCTNNKLEKLKVFNFQLFSETVETAVVFTVKTSSVDVGQTFTKDVVIGLNNMCFELESAVEFATIEWSMNDISVGMKSSYQRINNYCVDSCCSYYDKPCVDINTETSEDAGVTWVSSSVIGFNVCIQCVNDPLSLACYYSRELAIPIQYKAASFFIKEVLYTDRVNEYTVNSKEGLKELMRSIDGGLDQVTGHQIFSDYWRYLKGAVEQAALSSQHIDGRIFRAVGNRITNSLPR